MINSNLKWPGFRERVISKGSKFWVKFYQSMHFAALLFLAVALLAGWCGWSGKQVSVPLWIWVVEGALLGAAFGGLFIWFWVTNEEIEREYQEGLARLEVLFKADKSKLMRELEVELAVREHGREGDSDLL